MKDDVLPGKRNNAPRKQRTAHNRTHFLVRNECGADIKHDICDTKINGDVLIKVKMLKCQ